MTFCWGEACNDYVNRRRAYVASACHPHRSEAATRGTARYFYRCRSGAGRASPSGGGRCRMARRCGGGVRRRQCPRDHSLPTSIVSLLHFVIASVFTFICPINTFIHTNQSSNVSYDWTRNAKQVRNKLCSMQMCDWMSTYCVTDCTRWLSRVGHVSLASNR